MIGIKVLQNKILMDNKSKINNFNKKIYKSQIKLINHLKTIKYFLMKKLKKFLKFKNKKYNKKIIKDNKLNANWINKRN